MKPPSAMKRALGTLKDDLCDLLHILLKQNASCWRKPTLHFSLKRFFNYAILSLESGCYYEK